VIDLEVQSEVTASLNEHAMDWRSSGKTTFHTHAKWIKEALPYVSQTTVTAFHENLWSKLA
jgi:hypothetical protein